MNSREECDLPLLITSAIRVSAPQTSLSDEGVRLAATIEGISQWMAAACVRRIVLCDGSDFDLKPFLGDLLAQHPNVEVEVLAFLNDAAGVRQRGKGYGEGEIIKFALKNSRILTGASSFAKCTAKLWVTNFTACVRGYDGTASFSYSIRLRPRFVDTRFYVVSVAFYQQVLSKAHEAVDDSNGFYLEHAFAEALAGVKLSKVVMCPLPRINGLSGTTGSKYQASRLKLVSQDVRARLARKFGR